jgi:TetR/AcrR family transcriptional regulator
MSTHKIRSRSNPPIVRKRLKAEERRSQLLRIAKELFSECGFENTTTRAIAAAAGVTEAIIFRHFASKEELYANILDHKADEIGIETWGAELHNFAACKDDKALVLSVVKHILEADRRDPQFQKLMLQAALSGHPLHKITAQRLLPLHQFLCKYIKKRQTQSSACPVTSGSLKFYSVWTISSSRKIERLWVLRSLFLKACMLPAVLPIRKGVQSQQQ